AGGAPLDKAPHAACFRLQPQVAERVDREDRIPDPTETVIPIALTAGRLRQRSGRRRDDGAGGRVAERFQHDGGAHDADTMAAPVDYFAGPLAPPAQRLFVVPIELRDFSFLAETRALALLGRQELQADVISRVRSHLERPMKVV